MIEIILKYIGVFFLVSLLHEVMHIKGGGLSKTGCIHVETRTMTATVDGKAQYTKWYYLRGGLLAGIICLIFVVVTEGNSDKFVFFGNGIAQIIYGILEWHYYSVYKYLRYTIYIITPVLLHIIWYFI